MKFELMVKTAAFGSQYCDLACLCMLWVCVCFCQISMLCVVKGLTIQSCYLLLYKESYRLNRSFFIIEFLG